MDKSLELSKFCEIKLDEDFHFPTVFCPNHEKTPLTHISLENFALQCQKCLMGLSPSLKPPKIFKEVFQTFTDNLSNFQKKIYGCFKDLKGLREAQLTLFHNHRQKFNQIFDQYEQDSVHYFQKIKENIYSELDFDAILTAINGINSKKQLNFADFQEKVSFLFERIGLGPSSMEKNENNPTSELENTINILIEGSKNFTNELNIFLADSFETLKKSYNIFSSSSIEKIVKRTKNMRKFSIEQPVFYINDPEKTLEINGLTPFAKDIALIGDCKGDFLFSTCSNDEKIRLWRLKGKASECESLLVLSGHTDWVNRMLYHEERKILITSSRDHTIRIWDSETWKCVSVLIGHQDSVYGLSCFNDSPILASGSYDKTVKLWDIDTFSCKSSCAIENSIYEIRSYYIEEIGPNLVVGDSQGCLHFFMVVEGISLKKRQKVKGHEGCILRLVYIAKEKLIASSANKDKNIKLWNSLTMNIMYQLALHDERGVSGLFYDDGSQILFSAGKDNIIKMIRMGDMEVVREFKDSFIQFGGIAWIDKRKTLLTCGGKKIGQAVQMTINARFF